MATKETNKEVNNMNYEAEYKKLLVENEQLKQNLSHFVDELRVAVGVAMTSHPDMPQFKAMFNELYRIEK